MCSKEYPTNGDYSQWSIDCDPQTYLGEESMSDIAGALHRARTEGGLVNMGQYAPPANLDEAYILQSKVTDFFESETVGWKLGATNVNTLKLLGFDEPFMGPLLATHWYENGAEVAIYPEHSPSLETEFLVKLGANLPARKGAYTNDEVEAAIEYVCPAFEIVGCRVEGGFSEAGLMLIPDGAANLAVVQGEVVGDWRKTDLSSHSLPTASPWPKNRRSSTTMAFAKSNCGITSRKPSISKVTRAKIC